MRQCFMELQGLLNEGGSNKVTEYGNNHPRTGFKKDDFIKLKLVPVGDMRVVVSTNQCVKIPPLERGAVF